MKLLNFLKKHNSLSLLTLLLAINLITYHSWFFNLDILTYGDWGFGFPETVRENVEAASSLWTTAGNIGSISFFPTMGPKALLNGQLAAWGFPSPLNDRLIYFWPIVLFSTFGFFFLGQKVVGSAIGGFFTSLVFSFSVVTLGVRSGHLTIASAHAFFPFFFLLLMKTLETGNIKYAILAGLMGYIVSFNEIRVFYIVAMIVLSYSLYFIFITPVTFRKTMEKFFLVLIIFTIIGLLITPWTLGYKVVTPYQNTGFEFSSRGLFGVGFYDIMKSLTGWNIWWTGATQSFTILPVPLYFWSLPILVVLSFILNIKSKNITFFFLIFLIGSFLGKMSGYPFPSLYSWLYYNFPGFSAFREGTKFLFLVIIGQAVLIAAFINYLWIRWSIDKKHVFAKYLVTTFVAFLFLINAVPLITGEIKTVFVSRVLPEDYLTVKEFILEQKEFFRTLWIPRTSRWAMFAENHPKLGAVDLINAEWNKYIKDRREIPEYTEGKILIDLLNRKDAENLLNLSSIKYIFVSKQDVENEDDFFIFYGEPRRFYIQELDKISYLKKIDLNTKFIEVYENSAFRPHIYLTRNKDLISENVPFENTVYSFINPTLYIANLRNLSFPVYLNFSDKFHPDWTLKAGPVNWVQVLLNRDEGLLNQNHLENEAGFNSFLIDPEYILNNFPQNLYTKNQDGSINVPITLYFRPQAYLYLGLAISLVTLTVCLIFLIIPAKWFNRKV